MSKAGKRLIKAAKEAVAVAQGRSYARFISFEINGDQVVRDEYEGTLEGFFERQHAKGRPKER